MLTVELETCQEVLYTLAMSNVHKNTKYSVSLFLSFFKIKSEIAILIYYYSTPFNQYI